MPESRKAIEPCRPPCQGQESIAESWSSFRLRLLFRLSALVRGLRFPGRIAEAEESAEIGPVLVIDRFVDGLSAVPVRAGAVETAVQADLEVLLARRARGGAVHLPRVLNRRSAEMTRRTGAFAVPSAMGRSTVYPYRRVAYKGRGHVPFWRCTSPPVRGKRAAAGPPCRNPTGAWSTIRMPRRTCRKSCARRAALPALRDLDLAGITLEDEDLCGLEISGCRLTAATFTRVQAFTGAAIQLSFLDRATFAECDFSGVIILNAVFAGSRIESCPFTDSEIIQGNFLGIRGVARLLRSFRPVRLALHRLAGWKR